MYDSDNGNGSCNSNGMETKLGIEIEMLSWIIQFDWMQ